MQFAINPIIQLFLFVYTRHCIFNIMVCNKEYLSNFLSTKSFIHLFVAICHKDKLCFRYYSVLYRPVTHQYYIQSQVHTSLGRLLGSGAVRSGRSAAGCRLTCGGSSEMVFLRPRVVPPDPPYNKKKYQHFIFYHLYITKELLWS